MVRTVSLWLGLASLGIILTACNPRGNAMKQLCLGSTEERVQAAKKLGDGSGEEEAVRALVETLSDPVPEVQAAAAEALGKLGSQTQGDLWLDLQEGPVDKVVNATTLGHSLSEATPEGLAGMTLEFTSGPRKGERYQVRGNDAAELTIADRVDFQEKGKDVTGSTFKVGHPVSEALAAALTGAQWQDAALRAYEETVNTGSPTADIHLTLARLYNQRGRQDKAEENLDEAFDMAEDASMFVNVAREFNQLRARDKALKSLEEALTRSEENPTGNTYVDVAQEYATLGEPEQARKVLAKAEGMAATQPQLYAGMAGVYDLLGDKEKADAARAKAGPATPGGEFSFPGGAFPGGTFQIP